VFTELFKLGSVNGCWLQFFGAKAKEGNMDSEYERYLNGTCCFPFYDTFGRDSGNEKLTINFNCCPFCKSEISASKSAPKNSAQQPLTETEQR
jgi:hypothetical protein